MPRSSPASSTVKVSLSDSIVSLWVLTEGYDGDTIAQMFYHVKKTLSHQPALRNTCDTIEIRGVSS